ncbi:unnamed protein product [Moneuplotes crassus]|uniref:Uncharacterized protein n=1 Tax=Euplotes crassus TaxID=5936 RepID=A0AAD2DC21_EUPCR|nr:unnamed protein product [Moneuplotes crassus]
MFSYISSSFCSLCVLLYIIQIKFPILVGLSFSKQNCISLDSNKYVASINPLKLNKLVSFHTSGL